MSPSPLIGMTTYREPARWGVWDQSADLLPSTYAAAVESVGGVPVLLPPTAPYEESAAAVVARIDGLVISGGADVDPDRYGQDPHPRTGVPRHDRDAWELALLDAAADRDLPTLGVCRGMQVMAVGAGGTLEQHLPDSLGATTHDPGADGFGEVDVRIAAGSRLRHALGDAETVNVRCHHHQGVRAHPGYEAVAWAGDGGLEAMEGVGERFLVGVQWHPEVIAVAGLFRALVEASRTS
jgi:putative glutamine amidotransferase